MSGAKPAKKKHSLWQTLREASGSYRRLYGYVKPYKVRFILGLALGLAYGGVESLFSVGIFPGTRTIFLGFAPQPLGLGSSFFARRYRAKDQSIRFVFFFIPAMIML